MTLNGSLVDEVKDLGVVVDSGLSFDTLIGKTVARAFTRANLIHKRFVSYCNLMPCICCLCSAFTTVGLCYNQSIKFISGN